MEERTDTDIIAEKPEIVTLAGKEYEIKPQRVVANLAWRQTCGELSKELVGKFKDFNKTKGEEQEMLLLKEFVPFLFGEGLDLGVKMMFDYSSDLKADEEKIRAEASDEEMVNTVIVCFRFGFPFLKAMVGGVMKIRNDLKKVTID